MTAVFPHVFAQLTSLRMMHWQFAFYAAECLLVYVKNLPVYNCM